MINVQFFTQFHTMMCIHIVMALVITFIIVKIINFVLNKLAQKILLTITDNDIAKKLKTVKIVLVSTIDSLFVGFALLYILDVLGINIKPILATAGVVGIAISFGAQKSIEDLICGLTILFEGQLRVGDVVKIQDVTGNVEKVNLRYIMLRDIEGAVHYFRNSIASPITNYSKDFSYAVMDMGVAYKENISYVMDVIKQVGYELKQDENVGCFITSDVEILGLEKFEDSQVVIKFRIRTLPSRQWSVSRAYNLKLKEKFDELNIEIPFPQRVITKI